MNSLVRRMKGKSDLEKIQGVLMTLYTTGLYHGSWEMTDTDYVRGRMRDLVELLGLKFDDEGNIDWHKIVNEKELYARA